MEAVQGGERVAKRRLGNSQDPSYGQEIIELCRIMTSASMLYCLDNLMILVNIIVLGHLGKGHLASAILGNSIFSIMWVFIEGMLTSQDSLLAESVSNNDQISVRYWSYVSMVVILILCPVITIFYITLPLVIIPLVPINQHIASKALQHAYVLLPSMWCLAIFRVIQKYFLSQGERRPILVSMALGNAVNIVGNITFVYAFRIGFIGCSISTLLGRLCTMLLCLHYTLKSENIDKIYKEVSEIVGTNYCGIVMVLLRPFNYKINFTKEGAEDEGCELILLNDQDQELSSSTNLKESIDLTSTTHEMYHESHNPISNKESINFRLRIVKFAILGLSGCISYGLESWLFDIAAIFIVTMGSVPVNANQLLLFIIGFLYVCLPFSLSIACTIRIKQALHKKSSGGGKISARVSIVLGFLLMALTGLLFYLLVAHFGFLFSGDPDVIFRMKDLSLIATVFMTMYGVQGCAQGILRALHRQGEIASFLFLAMWVVGLPLSLYLCFVIRPAFGLQGFWYGYALGMTLLALALLLIVCLIDWDYEVRKNIVHVVRKRQQHCPLVGSRAVGGFLFSEITNVEELDDTEYMENLKYELG